MTKQTNLLKMLTVKALESYHIALLSEISDLAKKTQDIFYVLLEDGSIPIGEFGEYRVVLEGTDTSLDSKLFISKDELLAAIKALQYLEKITDKFPISCNLSYFEELFASSILRSITDNISVLSKLISTAEVVTNCMVLINK